jgi:hypothetical protein
MPVVFAIAYYAEPKKVCRGGELFMTKSALLSVNKNGPGYRILLSGRRALQFTVIVLLFSALARAETAGKTLIVVAHPDDEYYFAATGVQDGGSDGRHRR